MLATLPVTGFQLAAFGPMTLKAFMVPCMCETNQNLSERARLVHSRAMVLGHSCSLP
jgi:hypothetical protein